MNYHNEEWTIKDLIELIDDNKIDLRPPYQRNFIWSSRDQKSLIDTLHKGYPLPNFFILKYSDNKFEMIDGQQRAVTIRKFINNEFSDTHKKRYKDYDPDYLMDYKLNVVILENFKEGSESKEEFFYLVNKRGVQLNPSEVNHAYYHDTDFMRLVTKMLDYQPLIDLDIFTDKTVMRMNDRSLVEELAAYLFKGISDKRNVVEDLFEDEIGNEKMNEQYSRFSKIIDRISLMQKIKPISQTRYKQRNDFYTLFCFVDKHLDESETILMKQFNVLVFISDKGIITPSNDEYELFKKYAINCVSQSNSKHAREQRLLFFDALLANTSYKASEEQLQLIDFANNELGIDLSMGNFEKYFIVNIDKN